MNVFVQLLAAAGLMILITVLHGTGIIATARVIRYEEGALRGRSLAVREFRIMVPMALWLLTLHTFEIAIFAGFYQAIDAIPTFQEALLFSALAYTTLGHPETVLTDWPLVGAFEGLVGLLMIGWSVAVFVADMEKELRN